MLSDENYCTMIHDIMILQRNAVIAANYTKIQPHTTELTWNAMRDCYDHPELFTIDMVIVGEWDWQYEFSSRWSVFVYIDMEMEIEGSK